jgi:uncharacterized protein DUF5681
MTPPSHEYPVGYGRPPKETRWKKGQSGNPKRRYPARSRSTVEMIDRFFATPVGITVNGEERKVSTLEAIILQLWLKEIAGDRKALDVRLKYEAFARVTSEPRVEMIFVDTDYTRALAAGPPTGGTGDG